MAIEYSISLLQYTLDLRKPDLRKNLDLRKIVATADFLVHKLFDLRKKNSDFLTILEQFQKKSNF